MISFKGVAHHLWLALDKLDLQDLLDICYDANIKHHPTANRERLIELIMEKIYS